MPKKSHSALRRNFRELFATPTCVETASVFDPMSARIAADLGFTDSTAFQRAFKRWLGQTPGDYRRAQRRAS